MLTADSITEATIRSLRAGALAAIRAGTSDEVLQPAWRVIHACNVALHPPVESLRPLARWLCATIVQLADCGGGA